MTTLDMVESRLRELESECRVITLRAGVEGKKAWIELWAVPWTEGGDTGRPAFYAASGFTLEEAAEGLLRRMEAS